MEDLLLMIMPMPLINRLQMILMKSLIKLIILHWVVVAMDHKIILEYFMKAMLTLRLVGGVGQKNY